MENSLALVGQAPAHADPVAEGHVDHIVGGSAFGIVGGEGDVIDGSDHAPLFLVVWMLGCVLMAAAAEIARANCEGRLHTGVQRLLRQLGIGKRT